MANSVGSKSNAGSPKSGSSNRSPATKNGVTKNGSLGVGAKGAAVSKLQSQLNQKMKGTGYQVKVDGKFGVNTQKALEKFQAKVGLTADGFAGAKTIGKLSGKSPTSAPPAAPAPTQAAIGGVKTPAQLRALNNTRVDTRLPLGPTIKSYNPQGVEYKYGTPKMIETIKTVAARYNAATGRTLNVGDISKKGGGQIPGHKSHQHGRNVDVDMSFSDKRKNADPRRNSLNASYKSPAYDQAATRKMIQEIKRANPNASVRFNDPKLIREGYATYLAGHDNHLHLENMN
jgi:peptidoglycan hydrolase-like protein with peptidoglycan-binding domain